jgi:hypothetical protein
LTVSLETGLRPTALRIYLLYDRDCFSWLPGETQRHGAVGEGQFGQRDATGEGNKYPTGMQAAQRQLYGVIALQWASMPQGGRDAAALDASAPLPLLTLAFEVKGEAPLDAPRGGFLIAADTEYGDADTP